LGQRDSSEGVNGSEWRVANSEWFLGGQCSCTAEKAENLRITRITEMANGFSSALPKNHHFTSQNPIASRCHLRFTTQICSGLTPLLPTIR
jgi:hypothetical protein